MTPEQIKRLRKQANGYYASTDQDWFEAGQAIDDAVTVLQAAEAERDELRRENERLRAFEEMLPKTADGIRVMPVAGTKVWRPLKRSRFPQPSCGWRDGYPLFRACDTGEPYHGEILVPYDLTWSTREAAETAEGK